MPITLTKRGAALVGAALVLAGGALLSQRDTEGLAAAGVTSWSPPGTKPMSDAGAARLVASTPENVPGNAAANRYVPSRAQLAAFRAAKTSGRQPAVDFNPLLRYVTGHPGGLRDPSTDELIQWVSHKWGIPTNVIRAQVVVESRWLQDYRGDRKAVSSDWFGRYPRQARIRGGRDVYQSLGVTQIKWAPDGSVGAGTEPLRWKSTAFNLDYYAATVRYYYDGLCEWCDPGYGAGQAWNSIGGWYSPHPWANDSSRSYVRDVRRGFMRRNWTQIGR